MEPLNAATRAMAKAERKRIPMSVPVQKLAAPDMPGYHLHWFNGTPERIARALEGGYEFVHDRDMSINAVGIGTESAVSGNTDMGSQVSVVAGGGAIGNDGQPVRLILMKIKQEWYEEDQQLVADRNEQVAASLRGANPMGLVGGEGRPGDPTHTYTDKARTKIPDLFTPKRPKVATT